MEIKSRFFFFKYNFVIQNGGKRFFHIKKPLISQCFIISVKNYSKITFKK